MEKIILSMVRLYQKTLAKFWYLINPRHGCRFYPSCSEYCRQAIKKHGLARGLFKSAGRIFRCNPFSRGGVDLC